MRIGTRHRERATHGDHRVQSKRVIGASRRDDMHIIVAIKVRCSAIPNTPSPGLLHLEREISCMTGFNRGIGGIAPPGHLLSVYAPDDADRIIGRYKASRPMTASAENVPSRWSSVSNRSKKPSLRLSICSSSKFNSYTFSFWASRYSPRAPFRTSIPAPKRRS